MSLLWDSKMGSSISSIELIPSVFEGRGKDGDFEWMIKNRSQDGVLYIYQDGEHRIEAGYKNPSNNGSAVIRPYAFLDHPLAFGIPTGDRNGGYEFLTDHVKDVTSNAMGRLRKLLSTEKYSKVYYSAGQDGNIGMGNFRIGLDVRAYITSQLTLTVNQYKPECDQQTKPVSLECQENRNVKLVPSVFKQKGKMGDFEAMIRNDRFKDSLFIFNDNKEDFLFRSDRKGGGNAAIRPFQKGDSPRATGVPTGSKGVGYQKLTPYVKELILIAMERLTALLNTGRFLRVFYSAEENGTLGTGIFKVGDDVKAFIVAQLKITVGNYNRSINNR